MGPQYRPEPSTRGDRRAGELGTFEDLVATAALGPSLERDILDGSPVVVDIPELALRATLGGGVVLFLGEFTLASSRHCAQYAAEQLSSGRSKLVRAPVRGTLPAERRWHSRGGCYTYADCLQHARSQQAEDVALVAANVWLDMWWKRAPVDQGQRCA